MPNPRANASSAKSGGVTKQKIRGVSQPHVAYDPNFMYVLRTENSKFLGRSGKNLSLAIVSDVRDASPFVTIESAIDDGDRATQILGVVFRPVRMPVKNLIKKDNGQ